MIYNRKVKCRFLFPTHNVYTVNPWADLALRLTRQICLCLPKFVTTLTLTLFWYPLIRHKLLSNEHITQGKPQLYLAYIFHFLLLKTENSKHTSFFTHFLVTLICNFTVFFFPSLPNNKDNFLIYIMASEFSTIYWNLIKTRELD